MTTAPTVPYTEPSDSAVTALDEVRSVLRDRFRGNEAEMARELRIPQTSLNRAINPEKNPAVRQKTLDDRIFEVRERLAAYQSGSSNAPALPGGGPDVFGYLEEGAVPGVLLVIDFGGGTEVHVPVAVLGQGLRKGPPLRATGRVTAAAAPRTGEKEEPAGQRQPE